MFKNGINLLRIEKNREFFSKKVTSPNFAECLQLSMFVQKPCNPWQGGPYAKHGPVASPLQVLYLKWYHLNLLLRWNSITRECSPGMDGLSLSFIIFIKGTTRRRPLNFQKNYYTGCSRKIVFFHNSLQPLPRLHLCKRHSKLSTQCECTVNPIGW